MDVIIIKVLSVIFSIFILFKMFCSGIKYENEMISKNVSEKAREFLFILEIVITGFIIIFLSDVLNQ